MNTGFVIESDGVPNRLSVALGRQAVRRSFRFAGRATRTEVISYYIAAAVVGAFASVVAVLVLHPFGVTGTSQTRPWVNLALAVPAPALLVRRLHDQGRSARWLWVPGVGIGAQGLLAYLARSGQVAWIEIRGTGLSIDSVQNWTWDPLPIGSVVVLMLAAIATTYLSLADGQVGPNRYGPDPRLSPEENAATLDIGQPATASAV